MFANIIPNAKINIGGGILTYKMPPSLAGTVKIGQLVQIRLGSRATTGIITEILKKPATDFDPKKIKPIDKIIDPTPVIDESRLALARFIADHYFTSLPLTIFSMLPPLLRKPRVRELKEKEIAKSPLDSYKETKDKKPVLTAHQKKAFETITQKDSDSSAFLLFGITGSGKTEVYLRAIEETLKKNKSAIYIVPEISLTPQTIQRVINRFGKKKIAIIHSQMTGGQRLAFWQQIRNGKINIVIGSRSAIFAPLPNLGIIVIDEEHDLISFKSDQTPRYELHPVAEKMAEISGAKLILGTATPLAETWQKARDKQYELLELPERISTTTGEIRPRPMIKIIDSGREVLAKNYSPISLYLESALEEIVKYGRKALIFINRRGAATLIICSTCGWISKCPSCDIPFVYHLSKNKSVCHHCGKIAPPAAICPICSGLAIKYLGTGTQKIEAEIARMFPKTKILRLDRDITSKTAHKEIFDEFKKDESAILIGTQMIAHGWDIPEVDLVGILGADLMLNFPDFRAQEKTFELLVQLAGRAGRGSRPGIVVIQTNQPESAVYENVKKYEIEKFLDEELEARREHGYPPFTRLIKLSFGHKLEEKSKKEAVTLFNNLQRAIPQEAQQSLELLGPMPALLYRLHGRYWWQIIIKCHSGLPGIDSGRGQNDGTKQILDLVPNDWIIDIDPISLV